MIGSCRHSSLLGRRAEKRHGAVRRVPPPLERLRPQILSRQLVFFKQSPLFLELSQCETVIRRSSAWIKESAILRDADRAESSGARETLIPPPPNLPVSPRLTSNVEERPPARDLAPGHGHRAAGRQRDGSDILVEARRLSQFEQHDVVVFVRGIVVGVGDDQVDIYDLLCALLLGPVVLTQVGNQRRNPAEVEQEEGSVGRMPPV